jgi:probable rRNA maturation factor
MDISIDIDRKFAGCLKKTWVKNTVAGALGYMGIGYKAELSVTVTGQKQIHELNLAYLSEDRPTDVLSFPMADSSEKTPFVAAPDGIRHLGELVISFPQAVIQADQKGHTVQKELSVLIVHGVLHLLGYDHAERMGKTVMWQKQNEILVFLEKAAA